MYSIFRISGTEPVHERPVSSERKDRSGASSDICVRQSSAIERRWSARSLSRSNAASPWARDARHPRPFEPRPIPAPAESQSTTDGHSSFAPTNKLMSEGAHPGRCAA